MMSLRALGSTPSGHADACFLHLRQYLPSMTCLTISFVITACVTMRSYRSVTSERASERPQFGYFLHSTTSVRSASPGPKVLLAGCPAGLRRLRGPLGSGLSSAVVMRMPLALALSSALASLYLRFSSRRAAASPEAPSYILPSICISTHASPSRPAASRAIRTASMHIGIQAASHAAPPSPGPPSAVMPAIGGGAGADGGSKPSGPFGSAAPGVHSRICGSLPLQASHSSLPAGLHRQDKNEDHFKKRNTFVFFAYVDGAGRRGERLHDYHGLVPNNPSLLGHGAVPPGSPENSLLPIGLPPAGSRPQGPLVGIVDSAGGGFTRTASAGSPDSTARSIRPPPDLSAAARRISPGRSHSVPGSCDWWCPARWLWPRTPAPLGAVCT